MNKILIVDDEPDIRNLIRDILEDEGYEAYTAASGAEAEKLLASGAPDLMLLDIWMPGMDGVTLLRRVSQQHGTLYPIIVMSGHGTVETAVEATRLGAFDYVEKPLSTEKLLHAVRAALEARSGKIGKIFAIEEYLVGKSEAIRSLRNAMNEMSSNDKHVLLHGERGVGKELFARNLHHKCSQSSMFSCVYSSDVASGNMSHALEERLSQDHKASLFIYDVAELGAAAQKLLVKYIKGAASPGNGAGHARLMVATNGKPGSLNQELLQCLQHSVVEIPALRDRIEDIPDLLEYYANLHSSKNNVPYRHFSVASQNLLRHYGWPGNLHELRELCYAMLSSGSSSSIEPDEIQSKLQQHGDAAGAKDEFSVPLRQARQQFERRYIAHHLRQENYNVSRVAAKIGVERTYLYRKMRDLGMEAKTEKK